MAITEVQRAKRQQGMGSSDIAALFGVDPWKSSHDVWLEKTGKLDPLPENKHMRAGTIFEKAVLDWAAEGDDQHEGLGPLTQRGCERRAADLPVLVHLDAICQVDRWPVEVKTSGLFGPLNPEWGEEWTDEVPLRTIVQCHAHMLGMNVENPQGCHVPTFLGGRGFCMYRVHRNEQIIEQIAESVDRFWRENVLGDRPPETLPSLETLKRVRRVPETSITVPSELHEKYESARQRRLAAKKEEDAAKAALWSAMGQCEAADIGDPAKWYEVREYESRTIDAKALKRDLPAVYDQYLKVSPYRSLTFVKKPKAMRADAA